MKNYIFKGEKIDESGYVYGHYYEWIKNGKRIPIVGEGVKNGSVQGFQVIHDSVELVSAPELEIFKQFLLKTIISLEILLDDPNPFSKENAANGFTKRYVRDLIQDCKDEIEGEEGAIS